MIMEKKEAMKILKEFHDKSALFSVRTALDTVIPELKENKDEKMIIAIKEAVSYYWSDDSQAKTDILAWLEKQGKKEYVWSEEEEARIDRIINVLDWAEEKGRISYSDWEDYVTYVKSLKSQNKQNTAWSEEDKSHIGSIISYLESVKVYNAPHIEPIKNEIDWLKSIKDRVQPQHEQELNEKNIADVFEKVGLAKIVREQGYDALTGAVQSAMIELSKFTPQPKENIDKPFESEWIDLGLPSGTLWKSSNEEGFYTYDKAVETFGDQLPTKEQFIELKSLCRWKWRRNGYKVTGPNGNDIFLSASGYRSCYGNVFTVGTYGYYWSSTPYDSKDAWFLHFYFPKVYMDSNIRCYEWSVRLVKNK